MAQDYGYIRHALLGFSALHLAYLRQAHDRRYLILATSHHSEAIREFRKFVADLSSVNCGAVFIFSMLVVLLELGFMDPSHELQEDRLDPIDRLLQQFQLIRNVVALWRTSPKLYAIFKTNRLSRQRAPERLTIPTEIHVALQRLEDLNRWMSADLDERETYARALQGLRTSFKDVINRPNEWVTLLGWFCSVPSQYLEYAKARRPLALLLLAYYCVLVSHAPERWWIKCWSEPVWGAVRRELDDPWTPYLLCAVKAMQADQRCLSAPAEENVEQDAITH
jgi:hypothetical protein